MGWGVHDYPDPPDYTVPICPVCGEETDTLYADRDGEISGATTASRRLTLGIGRKTTNETVSTFKSR